MSDLRELRRKRGLTQVQLAEALRLTRPAISELEAGRRTPTVQTICAMAAVFRLAPGSVLNSVIETLGERAFERVHIAPT